MHLNYGTERIEHCASLPCWRFHQPPVTYAPRQTAIGDQYEKYQGAITAVKLYRLSP